MLLDTWAEFELSPVHHAKPCEILLQLVRGPLLIGLSRPDLCAFPQQFCVSSVMFCMSSLARSPCATRRVALAVSNMSHNDCHRVEFTWDLGPMIWRIQKRRQRCRRRCSKMCFRNPLRRSVNEYDLEPRHLPDFLSAVWAKVQGSPCTSFLVNTGLLSLKSSSNSIVTVRKLDRGTRVHRQHQ